MKNILTNCKVVCRDEIIHGTVAVEDGVISQVDAGSCSSSSVEDLGGNFLLPGLIEMHTDNLEKYIAPRPGILWPSTMAALLAHDMQICGGGITTVFDAIALGDLGHGGVRKKILNQSVEAIKTARENKLLRADHYLHLRCEIADKAVLEMIEVHRDDPLVRLLSIMDHTPGQRQWTNISKWRLYHRDKKWTDEDAERIIAERQELQKSHAHVNRKAILEISRQKNIPVASHDDTTEEHCEDAAREGISISEFPTTLNAASRGKQLGLKTVMGAPNVVRGESHSGNISALELAKGDLLDALSSDYMPISLLHAAFILNEKLCKPLCDTVAMVSSNIADMLGMDDRGRIAVGKRADLIEVGLHDGLPLVRRVWREGQQIL